MITGTKAWLLLAGSSKNKKKGKRKNYQDGKFTIGTVFIFSFLLSPGHRDSLFLITQIFILSLVRILVSQSAITCAYKAAFITGKMIKNL